MYLPEHYAGSYEFDKTVEQGLHLKKNVVLKCNLGNVQRNITEKLST